jgi:integrase
VGTVWGQNIANNTIMASISFRIKGKSEEAPILVRFRPTRELEFSGITRFKINPENWDAKLGFPLERKNSLQKLSTELRTLKENILAKYKHDCTKVKVDKAWLEKILDVKPEVEIISEGPSDIFLEYFDFYLDARSTDIGYRALQKFNVVKNYLVLYQNQTKEVLKVSEFGFVVSEKFTKVMLQNGYAINTTTNAIKFLKMICKHARMHGMSTKIDLYEVKAKNHKVLWPYLSFSDLEKIAKTEYPTDYLQNAADWLIISCNTGQRISDFMKFTKSRIYKDHNIEGIQLYIDIIQEKTETSVSIPIVAEVQEILDKREGEFPRPISDQIYNTYIKKVCKIAGITEMIKGTKNNPESNRNVTGIFPKYELVSSHIGRRSFATNYYMSGRYNMSDIMEITGHSSEKTFLLYINKNKKNGARRFLSTYNEHRKTIGL